MVGCALSLTSTAAESDWHPAMAGLPSPMLERIGARAVQVQLGETEFQQAWNAGRAMDIVRVFDLALASTGL
jgi:hypothetical protein